MQDDTALHELGIAEERIKELESTLSRYKAALEKIEDLAELHGIGGGEKAALIAAEVRSAFHPAPQGEKK